MQCIGLQLNVSFYFRYAERQRSYVRNLMCLQVCPESRHPLIVFSKCLEISYVTVTVYLVTRREAME